MARSNSSESTSSEKSTVSTKPFPTSAVRSTIGKSPKSSQSKKPTTEGVKRKLVAGFQEVYDAENPLSAGFNHDEADLSTVIPTIDVQTEIGAQEIGDVLHTGEEWTNISSSSDNEIKIQDDPQDNGPTKRQKVTDDNDDDGDAVDKPALRRSTRVIKPSVPSTPKIKPSAAQAKIADRRLPEGLTLKEFVAMTGKGVFTQQGVQDPAVRASFIKYIGSRPPTHKQFAGLTLDEIYQLQAPADEPEEVSAWTLNTTWGELDPETKREMRKRGEDPDTLFVDDKKTAAEGRFYAPLIGGTHVDERPALNAEIDQLEARKKNSRKRKASANEDIDFDPIFPPQVRIPGIPMVRREEEEIIGLRTSSTSHHAEGDTSLQPVVSSTINNSTLSKKRSGTEAVGHRKPQNKPRTEVPRTDTDDNLQTTSEQPATSIGTDADVTETGTRSSRRIAAKRTTTELDLSDDDNNKKSSKRQKRTHTERVDTSATDPLVSLGARGTGRVKTKSACNSCKLAHRGCKGPNCPFRTDAEKRAAGTLPPLPTQTTEPSSEL